MSTAKQRWWRPLAVLLAFTLVAAACGDDDEPAAPDTSAADAAAAQAEADAAAAEAEADAAAAEAEAAADRAAAAEAAAADAEAALAAAMSEAEGSIDPEVVAALAADLEAAQAEADAAAAAQAEAEAAVAAAEAAAEARAMRPISDDCPIPEPSGSVSVDVIGWEFPVTAEFARQFEDCNRGDLSVNVQLLASNDAQDQITLDLGTGSPEFEIMHMTNSTIGIHADNLMDLTPLIEKYSEQFDLGDIAEALWGAGVVDGRTLGVPVISNTMHFFYNAQILADNGVTPPTTFAEVIEACGVLQGAGFDDAYNMNISAGWSNDLEFFSIINSIGGSILNDDNTPAFNSAEGLAAVGHMVALRDACMSAAGRTFSIDDSEAALRAGELPMASIWASRAAAMDDEENSLVVGQIEFAPSLYTEEGSLRNSIAYVDLYAIPAETSVDPEVIFQVLMSATDLESQNAAAAHAAVSRSSASNADAPRNAAALTQSVAGGVGSQPKNPALPLAQGALGEQLLEVLQNDLDPATALANAEARYIEEATAAGFIG
jgi:ABC-type glycerol-3-phosphate transport system substrate-binding protein